MRRINRRRPLVAALSLAASFAALPVWAQQEQAPADRQGPEVQAESQDVTGGLEAMPAEEYDASGYLLGDLFGSRSKMAERGIGIAPVYTADFASNFRGGNDTNGSAFLHMFNLYVTVETEPLFGLAGGTFYLDFMSQHGQSPSDETGDYALVDEFDFGGRTQINELWYEQKLLENKLRIKLGKIDANTEFCFAENSFDFSNGGLNYGFPNSQFTFMPTAPDQAAGGVVFVYPREDVYVGGGIFDGALQEGYAGDYGPSTLFGEPADLYLVAEVGHTFAVRGTPWRVGVGATHHTGTFEEFDGGTHDGNTAFYAVLDATIWKENPADEADGQGLGGFFVYDTANSNITEVDQHFAAGLAWTGAIESRDNDVIGLGASYSHFAGEAAGFTDTGELVVEAFYKLAVTPFLSVKADLQYIKDPGGAGLEDAIAGIIRVQVAF